MNTSEEEKKNPWGEWTPERRAAHAATMREANRQRHLLEGEGDIRKPVDIPALASGRAKRVTCPNGHTMIYVKVPVKCPANGCDIRMDGTSPPESKPRPCGCLGMAGHRRGCTARPHHFET